MEKLQTLVGAEVNYVRFSYQVDINFFNDKREYTNLQIENVFTFVVNGQKHMLNPVDTPDLSPVLQLVHKKVVSARLYDKKLFLSFTGDIQLTIGPHAKYEAWNINGDNFPLLISDFS